MSLKNRSSVFESMSQYIDTAPEDIRPIWDRVLVRDLPEDDKIGSIFVPENAAERGAGKNGLIRVGVVVSVGPGDKFTEHGFDAYRDPIRRAVKTESGRLPMQVKPGDRVLYDRRKDLEVYIGGVRHSLINEQQSVLAVLD